jgi:acetyl/propionyl-CoA carboxylase alpha subunit
VKFIAVVAGQSVELEVDGDRVMVAGDSHSASLEPILGTPLRTLILDGRPVQLALESQGRGHWILTHGGDRWEVEVIDERTRHIRSLTSGSDHRRAAEVLRAPMPGLVVRVQAKPGDRVATGAGLVVLEAMKMENELKAPGPARVKSIRVVAGEAVEKGQVLVEFEDGEQGPGTILS